MKISPSRAAFTLVEMIISMAVSVLVIGALLLGSISLQKSLHASETYASSYSDQRRLIDYLARDLRRSIEVTATDSDGLPFDPTAGPLTVADKSALTVTLPGYYQSNSPGSRAYDQPLPVNSADRPTYGTATSPAPVVSVSFRKVFIAAEGCVCFVRQEANSTQVIVRQADDLFLRLQVARDRQSCTAEVWFRSAFSGIRPLVSTHDKIMLRNADAE